MVNLVKKEGFDYIIHTACPFIRDEDEDVASKIISEYQLSTSEMINEALNKKDRTKKIVVTGAASSVVGQTPSAEKDFVYNDPLHWAEIDE